MNRRSLVALLLIVSLTSMSSLALPHIAFTGGISHIRGFGPQAAAQDVLTIELKDIAYVPTEFTIYANTPTTLHLENTGAAVHDFVIDALDIAVRVNPGESTDVEINVPVGIYDFYCSIPGHKEAGMWGTLTAKVMTETDKRDATGTAVVAPTTTAEAQATATANAHLYETSTAVAGTTATAQAHLDATATTIAGATTTAQAYLDTTSTAIAGTTATAQAYLDTTSTAIAGTTATAQAHLYATATTIAGATATAEVQAFATQEAIQRSWQNYFWTDIHDAFSAAVAEFPGMSVDDSSPALMPRSYVPESYSQIAQYPISIVGGTASAIVMLAILPSKADADAAMESISGGLVRSGWEVQDVEGIDNNHVCLTVQYSVSSEALCYITRGDALIISNSIISLLKPDVALLNATDLARSMSEVYDEVDRPD